MHRAPRSIRIAWLGFIVSTLAVPARAGEPDPPVTVPRADVSVGFTLQTPGDVNVPPLCGELSLPCTSPRTVPDLGIAVAGAAYLHRGIAVVGEASFSDNVWYAAPTKEGRQDNYVRLLLGGVRAQVVPPAVGGRKATGVQIFGQLLAGTEWSTVLGARRAIQPGGGIDARLRDACVLRAEVDYTFVPGELRNLSGSRVFVGLVYGFGSREP